MDLMTVKDVATKLQLSPRSIWRMADGGMLPAPVRLMRSIRWRRSEIDLWIDLGCPARRKFEALKAEESKGVRA